MSDIREAPDHIPAELVFDFDIYADPRINHDVQTSHAAALADAPDIFWTRLNGGHWIAKSYDAITAIVLDPEHFSVREMQIPRVENPPFFIPLSLDPPENIAHRKVMIAASACSGGWTIPGRSIRPQLRGESANPVPDAKTCLLAGGPGAPTVSSAIFGNVIP